jgi:hypothetical protein
MASFQRRIRYLEATLREANVAFTPEEEPPQD